MTTILIKVLDLKLVGRTAPLLGFLMWFEKLPCPRLIRIANEMGSSSKMCYATLAEYNITFVFQEVFLRCSRMEKRAATELRPLTTKDTTV